MKQQTSVIEERPKSGNCLLNSLNKGGNTINTVAESSLNKEDGNENLIESNGNGSDLRMKIEPTVLDNNSMLNLPGDGTVDKLKPDGVIDSEESMSNSHCGEIDGKKSNKNIEKDSYSSELGESCMSGKYETGHHHAIGEHENEMSLPSHRDNNVQSSENLEMVLKKVLSESEVGNLEQSDGTSIDDNTGYKETEEGMYIHLYRF